MKTRKWMPLVLLVFCFSLGGCGAYKHLADTHPLSPMRKANVADGKQSEKTEVAPVSSLPAPVQWGMDFSRKLFSGGDK